MLACVETTLLLWFLSEQLLLTLVSPASLPIKEADWFCNQMKLWDQLSLLEVDRMSENRISAAQLPCRVRTARHLFQMPTVSTWRSNLQNPQKERLKKKKREEESGDLAFTSVNLRDPDMASGKVTRMERLLVMLMGPNLKGILSSFSPPSSYSHLEIRRRDFIQM